MTMWHDYCPVCGKEKVVIQDLCNLCFSRWREFSKYVKRRLPSQDASDHTNGPCEMDRKCFEKAVARGEQTFTLVAQDRTSPEVVAYWILKNIETAPAQKLRHALDDALRMRDCQKRKFAD